MNQIRNAKGFAHQRGIDNFARVLRVLAENENTPKKCSDLLSELHDQFPDLRELRNSAHHKEDRIRGLKHGKKIELDPIDSDTMKIPGGAIIIDGIINHKYTGTLGNGSIGTIEISHDTMVKLQKLCQRVFDSFEWTGPKSLSPY